MISVWDLAADFGIASVLLLACKFIRINVGLVQRLFIPVSMLAGLLALALGRNGFGLLPFSDLSPSYAGFLIAVIFGSLGLATSFPNFTTVINRTGKLFAYNQIITISQWLFAVLLVSAFLKTIWPELSPAFGIIMPAGFMGGHGTAAAVGESLAQLGWVEAMSLALATATLGVFLAVLGGLAIVNVLARLGHITHIKRLEDLEENFRKGLIPEEKREVVALETVSSSSVNVFTLHISLVGLVVFIAYSLAGLASSVNEMIYVPVFACAFLVGCLLRVVLSSTKLLGHFDDRLFNLSASSATDFLVLFGIASIQISVLIVYSLPFALLIALGILLCLVLTMIIAPLIFGKNWVEYGIFSWGWMTGTVAMGILLLRIVDPNSRSKVLNDYAIAYVPGSVVDILLVSLVPGLLIMGHGSLVVTSLASYLAVIAIIAFLFARKGRGVAQ